MKTSCGICKSAAGIVAFSTALGCHSFHIGCLLNWMRMQTILVDGKYLGVRVWQCPVPECLGKCHHKHTPQDAVLVKDTDLSRVPWFRFLRLKSEFEDKFADWTTVTGMSLECPMCLKDPKPNDALGYIMHMKTCCKPRYTTPLCANPKCGRGTDMHSLEAWSQDSQDEHCATNIKCPNCPKTFASADQVDVHESRECKRKCFCGAECSGTLGLKLCGVFAMRELLRIISTPGASSYDEAMMLASRLCRHGQSKQEMFAKLVAKLRRHV